LIPTVPFGITPELISLAFFLVGLALVLVSVETFIEAVAESALKLGVSSFFLTVVLAGADVENAVIGLAAVAEGLPGLAIGTVFGEAVFILGVAVGLAGILVPFETDVPHSYLLLVLVAPALLFVLMLDGTLSRLDGVILTLSFPLALGVVYLLERDQRTRYLASEEVEEALEADSSDAIADGDDDNGDGDDTGGTPLPPPRERYQGYLQLAVVVLATIGMTVGSQLAVMGAEGLLIVFGITGVAFGATVVGFISSLEEVFLTVKPVREGRPHIGVGNVVGSMLFFVTANPGVIALVQSIETDGAVLMIHFPFFVATLLLVAAIFWRGRIGRADGIVLMGMYVAYWGANYLS
jgi:cation:H+ antiporter